MNHKHTQEGTCGTRIWCSESPSQQTDTHPSVSEKTVRKAAAFHPSLVRPIRQSARTVHGGRVDQRLVEERVDDDDVPRRVGSVEDDSLDPHGPAGDGRHAPLQKAPGKVPPAQPEQDPTERRKEEPPRRQKRRRRRRREGSQERPPPTFVLLHWIVVVLATAAATDGRRGARFNLER